VHLPLRFIPFTQVYNLSLIQINIRLILFSYFIMINAIELMILKSYRAILGHCK
jgi:hypothetical protein